MWKAAKKLIEALFKDDTLLWSEDLKPHATGEFSMAVVQGNATLEDQCQVYTSPNSTLIGVYDGHGGFEASRFVNTRMLRRLIELETQHEFEGGLSFHTIEKAFSELEGQFLASVQSDPSIVNAGTCCIVGVITGGSLYVANLGDSRAVLGHLSYDLSVLGRPVLADRLTRDHNANRPDIRLELETLHKTPDVVSMVRGRWRVGGVIEVSRSIGDYNYKQRTPNDGPSLLSAKPEVSQRTIRPQDKFVIFATDGLWDQLEDDEAVKIVSKNPRRGIAKRLVQAAVEKGTRRTIHDDISVVVVFLNGGETVFDAGSTFTSCPEDISAHVEQNA